MFQFLKRKRKIVPARVSPVPVDPNALSSDARRALMNAQLAAQMVQLAGKTDDLAPLKQAEEAISAARNYYSFDSAPMEISLVQIALGDMLVKLGKAKSNRPAIVRAKDAYRAAITLASLHGDDTQRQDLRDKLKMTESMLGQRPKTPALFRMA